MSFVDFLKCRLLGMHTDDVRRLHEFKEKPYRFLYEVVCFFCGKRLGKGGMGGYQTEVRGDFGAVEVWMWPYGLNEEWSIRDKETYRMQFVADSKEAMELSKKLVMNKEFGDEFRREWREYHNT